MESFVTCCNYNNLELTISKTKQLVADYQRNKRPPVLDFIQEEEVKMVDSCKYLGVQINKKLDWTLKPFSGRDRADVCAKFEEIHSRQVSRSRE